MTFTRKETPSSHKQRDLIHRLVKSMEDARSVDRLSVFRNPLHFMFAYVILRSPFGAFFELIQIKLANFLMFPFQPQAFISSVKLKNTETSVCLKICIETSLYHFINMLMHSCYAVFENSLKSSAWYWFERNFQAVKCLKISSGVKLITGKSIVSPFFRNST